MANRIAAELSNGCALNSKSLCVKTAPQTRATKVIPPICANGAVPTKRFLTRLSLGRCSTSPGRPRRGSSSSSAAAAAGWSSVGGLVSYQHWKEGSNLPGGGDDISRADSRKYRVIGWGLSSSGTSMDDSRFLCRVVLSDKEEVFGVTERRSFESSRCVSSSRMTSSIASRNR
jgi:hypothetical protein